jgi:hypothetical protein
MSKRTFWPAVSDVIKRVFNRSREPVHYGKVEPLRPAALDSLRQHAQEHTFRSGQLDGAVVCINVDRPRPVLMRRRRTHENPFANELKSLVMDV